MIDLFSMINKKILRDAFPLFGKLLFSLSVISCQYSPEQRVYIELNDDRNHLQNIEFKTNEVIAIHNLDTLRFHIIMKDQANKLQLKKVKKKTISIDSVTEIYAKSLDDYNYNEIIELPYLYMIHKPTNSDRNLEIIKLSQILTISKDRFKNLE
jgi:hypothetical protein